MEKSFLYKNGEVHYTDNKDGDKAVVLIHGFGEDSRIWDNILSAFEGYRLIVPDLPGTGRSTILKEKNTSIADYAEAINALLEKENIAKPCIVGHSMGGYIAMAFAEHHPTKVDKLALIHSTSYADSEEKVETRKKGIAFIKEHGSQAFLKTSIPGLFKDEEKSKKDIDMLIDRAAEFSPETLIQYYTAMMNRPDLHSILGIEEFPVLIVAGKADKAVPLEQSLKESHLAEITHFHILEHSGHLGMLEEPAKLITIIKDFLNG